MQAAQQGGTAGGLADAARILACVAAVLLIGAGVLHVSAAADHTNLPVMMVGFLVVATAQAALGGLLLWRRPSRLLILTGLGLTAGALITWFVSRTAGLPFLPGGHMEPIGFKDGVTVLFELGTMPVLALLASSEVGRLTLPSPRLGTQALGVVGAGVFALFVPALVLGGGGHHSADQMAGAGHGHGEDGHARGALAQVDENDTGHGGGGHEHAGGGDVHRGTRGAGHSGAHARRSSAQSSHDGGDHAGGGHDRGSRSGGGHAGDDHSSGGEHPGTRGEQRRDSGHKHGDQDSDGHGNHGGRKRAGHKDHGGDHKEGHGKGGHGKGGHGDGHAAGHGGEGPSKRGLHFEQGRPSSGPGDPGRGNAFVWHDEGDEQMNGAGHDHGGAPCRPTPEQEAYADRLARATAAEVQKYDNNPARALADGFTYVFGPTDREIHMVNTRRVNDPTILEPSQIESFLYVMTDRGLMPVAGMYIMPEYGQKGPQPGGCKTQWHHHGGWVARWATLGQRDNTPEMMHVWTYPGLDPYGHYDGREMSQLFVGGRYVPSVCRQAGDANSGCVP